RRGNRREVGRLWALGMRCTHVKRRVLTWSRVARYATPSMTIGGACSLVSASPVWSIHAGASSTTFDQVDLIESAEAERRMGSAVAGPIGMCCELRTCQRNVQQPG